MGASLLASAILLLAGGPGHLTPRGAHVDRAWYVEPTQVLVEWHRVERVAPKGGKPYPNRVWHLVLWTHRDRWRPYVVIAGAGALDPIDDVRFADLTQDGHPDLLVSDVQGNHGSGPYRIVATDRGVPTTILSGYWAESSWKVRQGVLTVIEPRGGQSVCCPDFLAHLRYRWTGRRLVVAHTQLVKRTY